MPLAITLALALLPQGADDWPQFRGPRHDNTVDATDWSARGAAEPLWRARVGRGYSQPVVAGRWLVTCGYFEDPGEDRLFAFDASTGELRWQHAVAATDDPRFHEGGTLSTPAIRGDRVHRLDRRGVLRVHDLADGALLGARDYAAELGLSRTLHGFPASPRFVGDRIVLQLGGTLLVADADTGDVLWHTEDAGDRAYSNPALVDRGGRPALAAVRHTTLFVHDIADGAVLHEYPWPLTGNAVHCATPLVFGDRVFVSTAYNKGCAMLRLGEAKQPELLWAHRRMRNKVTSCVRHGDHLYGFDEAMLRCVGLDGELAWTVRGLGMGSLSLAGDRLLVLTEGGELIVAQATPTGFDELSRRPGFEDGGACFTSPVIVAGRIYLRSGRGELVCLDHRPGAAAEAPEVAAPAAAALFAAAAATAAAIPDQRALQLAGTWQIVTDDLPPAPMTLLLAPPDRWQLRLASGDLAYGHHDGVTWALEPTGARLVDGAEQRELAALFRLRELVAPPCPADAATRPRPTRLAGTACWQVDAETDDGETLSFWFATDDGRLVGSGGSARSQLVFDGRIDVAGVAIPRRITRFRASDGQQHRLEIVHAAWIPPDAARFELPPSVARQLRSPAEVEAAERALRTRFAGELGSYHVVEQQRTYTVKIDRGDLWLVAGDDPPLRIAVEHGAERTFPLEGPPIRIRFAPRDGEACPSLTLILGPGDDAPRWSGARVGR